MQVPIPPPKKTKRNQRASEMTMRDHIAVEAMRAMIIANNGDECMISLGAAYDVYKIADYMIKASER